MGARIAPGAVLGLAVALAACGTPSGAGARAAASSAHPPAWAPPGSGHPVTTPGQQAAAPASAHPSLASPGGACRGGDPLANVYHPYRLRVVKACVVVTGTVAYLRYEDDGDVHVDLALPASESGLLDRANVTEQHGHLVTEIVPADRSGCTPGQPPALPATAYTSAGYSYGVCTGADIATPPLGAQVRVTGPYVLDTDHGWMEVHPVWSMVVTSAGGQGQPASGAQGQPASGAQGQPASGAPATGSAGPWCQASAAPANDGYPGDYQVQVRSNQPDRRATASDAGDTWSRWTDATGYADIRLYHTSPGMTITVTVGGATCATTA